MSTLTPFDRPDDDRVRGAAPRFSPAWFAGVDLEILRRTPSERSFYNALGLGVLLLSGLSGFALCVAAGYMLRVPPSDIWWLGVGWAVILAVGVERIVLQTTSAKKRWLLVVLIPRVCFSFLLAIQMGEPLMLRVHQDVIDERISAQRRDALHAISTQADEDFNAKIAAAKANKLALVNREKRVKNNVGRYQFLHDQAKSGGRCDAQCWHYDRRIDRRQDDYDAMMARHDVLIPALDKRVEALEKAKAEQITDRTTKLKRNTGLAAREQALSEIMKAQPVVHNQVWFLRLLFLSLDLLPLAAKLTKSLSGSAYEEQAKVARRRDSEAARVEEKKILEKAHATREYNRIRTQVELAKRIDDIEDGHGVPHATSQRISVWDLDEFTDNMRAHERYPAPVPEQLRRGGFVGLAALTALTAVAVTIWAIAGHAISGTWLVIAAVLAASALAGWTRGFRKAPVWGLRAIFATLVVGLALPFLIFAVNV